MWGYHTPTGVWGGAPAHSFSGAIFGEDHNGDGAELFSDILEGIIRLVEQPPFDERDYPAGEELGDDIGRDRAFPFAGAGAAQAIYDVMCEDGMHSVEHQRAVRCYV